MPSGSPSVTIGGTFSTAPAPEIQVERGRRITITLPENAWHAAMKLIQSGQTQFDTVEELAQHFTWKGITEIDAGTVTDPDFLMAATRAKQEREENWALHFDRETDKLAQGISSQLHILAKGRDADALVELITQRWQEVSGMPGAHWRGRFQRVFAESETVISLIKKFRKTHAFPADLLKACGIK